MPAAPQVHNAKVDEVGLAAADGPAAAVPQARCIAWRLQLRRDATSLAEMLPSNDQASEAPALSRLARACNGAHAQTGSGAVGSHLALHRVCAGGGGG